MAGCHKVPAIHIFAVALGAFEIIAFAGVIFGWHSVVYIYKDTGYFSHLCPNHTHSPGADNITEFNHKSSWRYHSSGSNVTAVLIRNNSEHNDTSIGGNGTSQLVVPVTPRSASVLTSHGNNVSSPGSSVNFDELSCIEKIHVRAEEGSSQVCESQDEQFNLIFSIATTFTGMMSFPCGFIYDRLGTRITRTIAIIFFLLGQLLLIIASPSKPYLLFPGFIGLSFGGYQLLLTNLQLSVLIPNLRSTIMSSYSGTFDSSASIFLLFKTAYEAGISINTAFIIQTMFYMLVVFSTTFCFLPKTRLPFPLDPGYRLYCWLCHKLACCEKTGSHGEDASNGSEWEVEPTGNVTFKNHVSSNSNMDVEVKYSKVSVTDFLETKNEESKTKKAEHPNIDDSAVTPPPPALPLNEERPKTVPAVEGEINLLTEKPQEEKKKKTFRQVVFSPLFLMDVMWLSIQRLRSWIFVGMFNTWITRMACGDKPSVSHYTSVYAGMQLFGILIGPISGRLMDRKIKGANEKYADPRCERIHASILSFLLCSTASVLLTVGTLIPILQVQYITFALHCIHRSLLYGPNSAFVANAFPNEHFGKLFGVTLTISALFSMIQYPMFIIVQEVQGGDPLAINIFLLVLMVISFTHPVFIWRYLKKKASKSPPL